MIEYYFPLNKTKICKSDKAWMTPSFKIAIAKRQKAFHIYGKNSEAYKFWRNKIQRDVKSARSQYFRKSVEKLNEVNPSRWWREVKSLGGLKSSDVWYQHLLSDDNPTLTHLAESYNNFLVNLTSHFNPLLPSHDAETPDLPNEFLVNYSQVYTPLRQIKTSKSPGPDMIPNKLLKMFACEFAPALADIYVSMQQGVFPQRLKRAIVRPIPKQSPPTSIEDDLRPISLTSQVSKLLEGFTLKLLLSQVADQLDPKQFSLPKKSTTQAVVYMLHSLLAGLESGQRSVRIFFADFKKGFDLVDHNVLNDELVKLGAHPAILRWVRDFLTNREQCVQIQSSCSSWKRMNGGLPQGTKLGPLLFAILVNNLLKNWHGRIKFVDYMTAFAWPEMTDIINILLCP